MSEWQQPVPAGSAPIGDAGPVPVDVSDAPVVRRRRGRRAAIGLIGVLALVATGLAVTELTGADGAGSPEEAVQAFFDAVGDEDALGVLESLSPSERDQLVPSVRELAEQLTRVEVTDEVDLEKVGGLDLRVEHLALRTYGLHPDVAAVEVAGGIVAVATSLGDLPLGDALSGALEEAGLDLDQPLNASEPLDLTLVTVRSGGDWHVSLLYSLAEAERSRSDRPVPDFGYGIPAKGADSPRAAVDAMVAAFNDDDLGRMIELTPPDTMAVLHDYGPGLVDVADRDGDDEGGPRVQLEDVEVGEPEGSGDTRRLSLERYRYVTSDGDEELGSLRYDGSCVTSSYPEWSMSSGDGAVEATAVMVTRMRCVGDPAEGWSLIGSILPPAGPLLFGPGKADIVVVERGGAWYVEPARSLIDMLLVNVESSSADEMEDTLAAWLLYLGQGDELWAVTVGTGSSGYCTPSDDDARPCDAGSLDPEDRCYDTPSDDADVEACLRRLGDPDAVTELHRNRCYGNDEAEEVDACLQHLVDNGELGADVLAEFRCTVVYEALSKDISDEDYAEAGEVFERCMVDAGSAPGG